MNKIRTLTAVALIVASIAGTAGAEFAAPSNLRCEYRVNPLGIDALQPRLSWNLQSRERGQLQSAYQLLVASTPGSLAQDKGDLWDSGRVNSSDAIQIVYAGQSLSSHQICWWKVRVWDQDGKESPWSEPAMWSMGVLATEEWSGAQWIGIEQDSDLQKAQWIWYPEDNPPPGQRFFRKVFELPAEGASKATCLVAADNEAEVFVNDVSCGTLNDYHTAKDIPVVAQLRPGKNVIAVSVKNVGDSPNPAGLLGLLSVDLPSGETVTFLTSGDWKAVNEEQAGWQSAEFDDNAWKEARVLGPFGMEPWKQTNSEARVLPARMLRKEFEVKKPVRRATAYLSGLGLSEMYVNGSRIGDAVLSPGCTQYPKRVFYVTYEVGDQVETGMNALGVWLGNGRYYAPRATEPTNTDSFGSPRMLCLLRLEYEDGSTETVVSDTSWKATDKGPIRANNEYDGETYDARMELPGWSAPGFDESKWISAESMAGPGGALSAQMAEPIRVIETLRPVGITNPQPGLYVLDMGQNMVGWCRMVVSGPKGATVWLRHAETLQDDGTLYLANIRGAKVTDEYVLKGEGVETYEPRFTYHGFRYVEITGFPGEPTLDTIEGLVVHDDVEPAGTFRCSNLLINQIARNIRWGVRGNYRSMPTDCPQRDERQGWLGDRSEECRGESYLFNISSLYAKWVGDMEDAQRDDGSVSDVCPAYWPLYNDNVTWPSTFIIAPGMLYDQYGDLRVIERHYDGMKKWIVHMQKYLENDIMPRDSYGDWCVPPEEQHLIHSKDPARKTPGDFLGTSYFYYDLRCMARYANLLNKKQDAEEFLALADRLKTAFNKKFLNEAEGMYANGAETTCVLPLAFGLAPDNFREKLFTRLTDHIMNAGKGHLATGLVGGQWLMRTLSDNGRPDIAFTLASQSTYPSWGYMIGKNATTIWELWNGDTADPAMNSHNHVMLVGDLNIWLYEYVAGIRAAAPGFKEVVLRPYIAPELEYADGSYQSAYGQIFSRWRKQNGRLYWQVTVPANVTARVHVPTADAEKATESGKPLVEAEGLKIVKVEKGAVVLDAGSGQYSFEAPIQ